MAEKKKSKAIYALLGLGLIGAGVAYAFYKKKKSVLKIVAQDQLQYPVTILIEDSAGEMVELFVDSISDKEVSLEPGDYFLTISKIGYISHTETVTIIKDEEKTVTFLLEVGVAGKGELTVKTIDGLGNVLPSVQVEINYEGQPTYSVTTNNAGEWIFLQTEVGTYTITSANKTGYSWNNTLGVVSVLLNDGDKKELTAVMEGGVAVDCNAKCLEIVAVNCQDTPLFGTLIPVAQIKNNCAFPVDGKLVVWSVGFQPVTTSKKFSIPANGTQDVAVSPMTKNVPGGVTVNFTVAKTCEGKDSIEDVSECKINVIAGTGTLNVLTVDEAGLPVSDVNFVIEGIVSYNLNTDLNGTWTFPATEAGTYITIQVAKPGWEWLPGQGLKSVVLAPGGTETITLVLKAGVLPICNDGETVTEDCGAGMVITTQECVGGQWVLSGETCPTEGNLELHFLTPEALPANVLIIKQEDGSVLFDGLANEGQQIPIPANVLCILTAESSKAGYKSYGPVLFTVQGGHTSANPYIINISLPKQSTGCVNFNSNVSGFNVEIIGGGVWNLSCGGQTCQQCELPIAEGEFNQYLYTATKPGYTSQTGGWNFPPGVITANININLSPIGGTVTFEITDSVTGKPLEYALIYVDTAYKGQTDGNGKLIVDLSAGSHKTKVTKQGYEDGFMNFSLADGQNKTVPIDIVEIAPKKEVLVVYPWYAVNKCGEASPTDKEISKQLYDTLKTKSKISPFYAYSTSVNDLNIGSYDVIILVGGSWAWNDCNSFYTGEEVFTDLGFPDTTTTKSSWCNTTTQSGTKIYALGGWTAQDTLDLKNCFVSQLNADGSNIDSISCSTVEGCA